MRLLTQILDTILPTRPPLRSAVSAEELHTILRNKPSPARTPASWIVAGYLYRDHEVRQLILHLKKYKNRQVAAALGRRLHDALAEAESEHHALHGGGPTILVPIPLHSSQMQKRGFNQSALLAHSLSGQWGHRQVLNALRCIKHTHKQALLSREARYRNMAGTLMRTRKQLPSNALVVLVDDVTTTGATLREARLQFVAEVPPHRLLALTVAH